MFGLGDLEGAVMAVLWRAPEPLRICDVLTGLDTRRPLAYTTVMTVLDNLRRKGWADRDRGDRAYLYRAALSREEAAARALRETLDASGDPEAALLHFANDTAEREAEVLRAALRCIAHRS